MHSDGKKGQQYPGLHEEESCQQVEGHDPAPLLSIAEKHLGSCAHFWAPQYKKDLNLLESSAGYTKMVKELEHLSYEERLRKLGLFSLDCSQQCPMVGHEARSTN